MQDFVKLPDESIRSQLNVTFSKIDSIIPVTLGTLFRPNQEVNNKRTILLFVL